MKTPNNATELTLETLNEVNGGWCGTPVPGRFPFPVPPAPQPWELVATTGLINFATPTALPQLAGFMSFR